MVLNAVHWVPQSRPRLFVIGVHSSIALPQELRAYTPSTFLHPAALRRAFGQASEQVRDTWIWWNLPKPAHRKSALADVIEEHPASVRWHTADETKRLYELMPPIHRAKVSEAARDGRTVGTVYRRIRRNDHNEKKQVAEVRFDGVSGCLRTGSGGSSKQFIFVVEGDRMRSRLLSTREAARLMGVPDEYKLPENYSEAYHLLGDGLAVPVVAWLERHLLSPLLGGRPILVGLPNRAQSQPDGGARSRSNSLYSRGEPRVTMSREQALVHPSRLVGCAANV